MEASPSEKAEFHENFLTLVAGLDQVRMSYRRASPSTCVYMENSSLPSRDLGYSIARSCLGGLALHTCKRKQILRRI